MTVKPPRRPIGLWEDPYPSELDTAERRQLNLAFRCLRRAETYAAYTQPKRVSKYDPVQAMKLARRNIHIARVHYQIARSIRGDKTRRASRFHTFAELYEEIATTITTWEKAHDAIPAAAE